MSNLQSQLYTDDLTGLYNRRFFTQCLNEETDKSLKKHLTFALVMLDMDHFKEINDTYGHLEGDQALVWMANILKRSVRLGDIVIRFAGDEFFLILPGATKNEALVVTERIYTLINDNPFKGHTQQVNIPVNVSGGLAFFPQDANTPETLINLADQGLYLAKERGRGQACLGREAEKIKTQINLNDALKDSPFIGRDALLKQLLASIHNDLHHQNPHFYMLGGEEGVGKSRLLTELIKLVSPLCSVVHIRLPYQNTTVPFMGLKMIISEFMEMHGDLYAKAFAALSETEKGTLNMWHQAGFNHHDPLFRDSQSLDFKSPSREVDIHFALNHFFEKLAEYHPVLIAIDDCQWLDHETCQFFSNLLFQIKHRAILIAGTLSKHLQQTDHPEEINRYIAYLGKQNLLKQMDISPLSVADIKSWTKHVFVQASDIFLDILSRQLFLSSGGNPLLIKEGLQVIPVDKWQSLLFNPLSLEKEIIKLIPERITQNLQKSFSHLSNDLKSLLTFLVCLDEPFVYDDIIRLSSFNEGHLIDLLDFCVSNGWLKEITKSNTSCFLFQNHHSKQFLSHQISNIKKIKTHQMVLEFLEQKIKSTEDSSTHCETLFYHAVSAKHTEKIIEYGNRWISVCHETKSYHTIEKIFQTLKQECGASNHHFLTETTTKISCEALFHLGQYDLFSTLLTEVKDSQFNLSMNYKYYQFKGQYKKACQIAKYLHEEATSPIQQMEWGIAYAESLIKVQDFIELHLIQDQLKKMMASQESSKDTHIRILVGHYYKFLGNYHFSINDIEKALIHYQTFYTIGTELKSPALQCLSLLNMGSAQFKLQLFEEAKKSWILAQSLALKCGIKHYVLQIMNNLGNIYRITDDWDMAEQIFSQCLNMAETQEEKPVIMACLINLGFVYLKKQNYRQSGFYLHTGLKLSVELKDVKTTALFHDRLGDLNYELKDFGVARKEYQAALQLFTHLHDIESELFIQMKILKLSFLENPQLKSKKTKISKIQTAIKNLSSASHRKDALWQQSLTLEKLE